jgi:carboxylesterase
MRYLAERLHSHGLTVSVPRLPGHGTNGKDFHRTTWRDWLSKAVDEYIELSTDFAEVMVGGLSMGGVISVILASHFPVSRVALFAPALYTTNRLVPFTPLLRLFVPPRKVTHPEEYEDPGQQYLADEYWNWQWPDETASLYHLIRMARRRLTRVTAPILTVASKKDETVPLKVTDLIDKRVSAQHKMTVLLEESGHVVTTGVEKNIVADALEEWFLKRSFPGPQDEGYHS